MTSGGPSPSDGSRLPRRLGLFIREGWGPLLRSSKLVAADVALRLVGEWGVVFVGLTVVLSTFGTLNGSLLTLPRIFFALAEDGLFPRPIAAVHSRFQTP